MKFSLTSKLTLASLSVVAIAGLFLNLSAQGPVDPRSNVAMTAGWTGTPNEFDVNAAHFIVDNENARLLALDPPGTLLLKSTGAELKASATTVLEAFWDNAWESYGSSAIAAGYVAGETEKTSAEVKALYSTATDTGRAAAISALEANQIP